MSEGWLNDEYLILFSEAESTSYLKQYCLSEQLPGYTLVGLRDWDDFIVLTPSGEFCCIPTIPISIHLATRFALSESVHLESDARFTGKIKWYLTPTVFGGNPEDSENLAWINLDQHVELVIWWNERYRGAHHI